MTVARRLTTLLVLVVLAVAGTAMLWPGRATLPPIDRDESRYAQATRQMLDTGDYLDVRFQDTPRYVQPAGVYWMQAAAVTLTGETAQRVIWPHRLPSLVAGALAVALTGWIGAAFFGLETGLAAGLLFAGCLIFNFEARIATTDAVLLGCVMLAQAALAAIWQRRAVAPSRAAPPLFWIALGLGLMVKGPVALLVPAGTIIGLLAIDRDFAWLRRLRLGIGVPILVLIVVPWLVAIGLKTQGDFFRIALGHNLVGKITGGQEAHGQPPGFYLLIFALMFWPGSLFAFRALPGVWAARRTDAVKFLLSWILPAYLVFETVATKLPQYVMPVYPAVAILAVAPLLAAGYRRWQKIAYAVFTLLWGLIGAGLSLGVPVVLGFLGGGFDLPGLLLGGFGLLLLVAAWRVLTRGQPRPAAGFACLAALFILGNDFGRALPGYSAMWVTPRLVAMAKAVRPCPDSVMASAGYAEPSLVFLLGTPTMLGDSRYAAQHLIDDRACGYAAVEARMQPAFIARLAEAGITPRALGTLGGINYSHGQRVSLTLYDAVP